MRGPSPSCLCTRSDPGCQPLPESHSSVPLPHPHPLASWSPALSRVCPSWLSCACAGFSLGPFQKVPQICWPRGGSPSPGHGPLTQGTQTNSDHPHLPRRGGVIQRVSQVTIRLQGARDICSSPRASRVRGAKAGGKKGPQRWRNAAGRKSETWGVPRDLGRVTGLPEPHSVTFGDPSACSPGL